MNKATLSEFIAKIITQTLTEVSLNYQKLYKPKRRHVEKYRKSRYHPAELEKQKKIKAIQQEPDKDNTSDSAYELAPNVRVFLNTTLEAIPKSETSTKILHGVLVNKSEAMALARVMLTLPGFPFRQPRKLMNLLILLAKENQKHTDKA
jgi:hypothetical protein